MKNFTDGQIEAEGYKITEPFVKRVYKSLEEHLFLQVSQTIVRVHAWFLNILNYN